MQVLCKEKSNIFEKYAISSTIIDATDSKQFEPCCMVWDKK